MSRSQILEVLEKAENVKPIAEKNGRKIVTFEDSVALANAEGFEPTPDTGIRKYNPDGSLAGIRTATAAINPNSFFANRYKVMGKPGAKKMGVVIDWRAIQEQQTGRVYLKTIPSYIFARDEQNNLFIEKIEKVSDSEFMSDYTNTLDNASMAKIAPLIAEFGTESVTSELPI